MTIKNPSTRETRGIFTLRYDIIDWLNESGIRNYHIYLSPEATQSSFTQPDPLEPSEHWQVDVAGEVLIRQENLFYLPVNFGVVEGSFNVCGASLQTLEGCPQEVGEYFFINRNQLKSLKGMPTTIGKGFMCDENEIETLDFFPAKIGGHLSFSKNKLTSLTGLPAHIPGNLNLSHNALTNLKGLPEHAPGNLDLSHNALTSLEYFSKQVDGSISIHNNQLTQLKHIQPHIKGHFNFSNNLIDTLQGGPQEVQGDYDCSYNKLRNFEGIASKITGDINCRNNTRLRSLEGLHKIPLRKRLFFTSSPIKVLQDLKFYREIKGKLLGPILEKVEIQKQIAPVAPSENGVKLKTHKI